MRDFDISLAPIVQVIDLELSPPVLEDLRADDDRVKDALAENGLPCVRIEFLVLTKHFRCIAGEQMVCPRGAS